ncbi:MAG: hypothetical protein L3J95_03205 [Thermoplasmata archaeon]|nr:hypothetical protein [Thermoplasmata archaeon]MCI4359415.1 hypothetical protein [Thermoplasmata archaeon]
MAARRRSEKEAKLPSGFTITRELPPGRHPLLAAFPDLGRLEAAGRLEPDSAARTRLFEETCVQVVEQDVWMYVAPHSLPKAMRRRWKPHVSPGSDCIVVGAEHLKESPALILYLDIFHELCHIRQRQAGLELFDRSESYVRRPTEIEAYRFAVEEARRLGVSDEVLRDYLRVEWVTEDELLDLFKSVGVSPAST